MKSILPETGALFSSSDSHCSNIVLVVAEATFKTGGLGGSEKYLYG